MYGVLVIMFLRGFYISVVDMFITCFGSNVLVLGVRFVKLIVIFVLVDFGFRVVRFVFVNVDNRFRGS